MTNGTFASAINSMDAKRSSHCKSSIREKYNVDYVDAITPAGPCIVRAEEKRLGFMENIKLRIDRSVNKHFLEKNAVVVHFVYTAV